MTDKRILVTVFLLLMPSVIQAQSLAVTNLSQLSFGEEIFPGSSKSISRTEAASASFEVSGEAGREVHITFELPQELITQDSEVMDISFSTTNGGYHSLQTEQANATAFDPANGLITTLDSDGSLYLWLGGTIYPARNQAGGYYSADITANVSYTTN